MNTIFLGVEKIDDAGLDSIRKRTKGGADTNVKAIEILRRCGITPITTFLTDPSWDEQDFDRVEEFITRLKLPNPSFTVLTPLPGTELWEHMKSDVITEDYSRFDILHLVLPSKLAPQRFYQRFARLCSLTDVRTHFSWQAVWTLIKLALRGHGRVVLQVFRAMRELCNPSAYLGSPGKERKPDFIPDDFAAIPRLDKGMSHLVDRILDTRTNEDKLEAKSQKQPEPKTEVRVY